MIELLTHYYNYTEEQAMDYIENQVSRNGDVIQEFFEGVENKGEADSLSVSEYP